MKKFSDILWVRIVALAVIIFTVVTIGARLIPNYDYSEKDFIAALENGEDVREKTVQFEIKDIEENVLTGWTMTSQNDVLFINGIQTDDEIGDTVIVEVRDTGSAFGTWIVTTRAN